MAQNFSMKIEEKYYQAALINLFQKTEQAFEAQESDIMQKSRKGLTRFFGELAEKQKAGLIPPIGYVNFSFLYTSLYFGEPKFQLDCYGEEWMMESDSYLTGYISAAWLTQYLDDFKNALQAGVNAEKISRYVHPERIQVFGLRAIRSLLYYYSGYMKYRVPDMIDQRQLSKVNKTKKFSITFGEYLDWQKIVYAAQPEVDIFNLEEAEPLTFRIFRAVYYKEKNFQELTLSNSTFKDCSFIDTDIKDCNFNDCIFENCLFDRVQFSFTSFWGASFINCNLKNCGFSDCEFSPANAAPDKQKEFYKVAEFYCCNTKKLQFSDCDLTDCGLQLCEIENLQIEGGKLEGSDFIDLVSNNLCNQEEA